LSGQSFVGKSTTLVAHACKIERVQDHFFEIFFFQNYSFTDDELATFRDRCARIHPNHVSVPTKKFVPHGSQIIVTSRSEKITKFGTTQAVTLKYLPHEAYWYFLKTLTFGSMDPKVQPRLTHLAMEIASTHALR
jgi:hypothetical protein